MAVLNYWSCYSVTTGALSGTATLNIKVPGTYTGITQADTGRTILRSLIAFSNPAMGDRITSISVTDTDGAMVSNDRSFFPAYPILGVYGDPEVAAGNKVMFLAPSGPGWTDFVPASSSGIFIPAQMYINVSFQKASIVSDTVYVNLLWSKVA
ncbi:MAG TPA: hypothetical protein V6C65_15520 [Allocoleopsis sp.]